MLERKVSIRDLLKRLGLYANKNEDRGSEAQDQFIERWLRIKTGILIGDTTTEPTDPLDVNGSANISGAVTVGSTVDGRDIDTDGTKLDTVEDSAKDDQTGLEIVTLLEALAAGDRLDHGSGLTGLGDDDHTIYLLAAGTRAATLIFFDTAAAAPDANAKLNYDNTYKRLRFHDGSELRFVDPRGGAVNQNRLKLAHITIHIGSVGASAGGNYAAFSAKETMRIQGISIWARAEAGTADATVDVRDDGSTILTGVTTIVAAATVYTASIAPRIATIAEGSTVSIYLTTDSDGSLNDLTVDIAYYAS